MTDVKKEVDGCENENGWMQKKKWLDAGLDYYIHVRKLSQFVSVYRK